MMMMTALPSVEGSCSPVSGGITVNFVSCKKILLHTSRELNM